MAETGRRVALVVTAVALAAIGVTTLAPPAAAGGISTLDLDDGYAVSGRRLSVGVQALFDTRAAARRAVAGRGLAVWLEPGTVGRRRVSDWQGLRAGAVRAELEGVSGERDVNLADLRLHVRLPELVPGRYTAVLCNPACDRLVGDVWPTPLQVLGSPAELRLQRHVDAWQARFGRRLAAGERRLRRLVQQAADTSLSTDSSLRLDLEALRDDTEALRQRVDAMAAVLARDAAAAQAGAAERRRRIVLLNVLAAAVVAGAVAWWLRRRRPRRPPAAAVRDEAGDVRLWERV